MKNKKTFKKGIILFSLILAGEMIFSLPFHLPRFFRPTMLEVFQISNTQLGDIFTLYGVFAMLSYFPGGALTDRFSAKKLMALSLAATAAGGIYLAQIPGIAGLRILFGFWGVTTILLFWAGLIKSTRIWGESLKQGRAFGLLDGGRGFLAAGFASIAVLFFSHSLSVDPLTANDEDRVNALQTVIYFYSALTLVSAVLVWFVIPETGSNARHGSHYLQKGIRKTLKNRFVWLQSAIVVCAYCGYKSLDHYGLYANQVLDMNEVEAARFVSNASYLRAAAAIGAGFLVDRLSASQVIRWTFLWAVLLYFLLSFLNPGNGSFYLILANLIFSFIAVYALRGVYFALLEETQISGMYTGTAVGIISLIGFTPDIFFNALAGRILDASPGIEGFQHFFMFLAFLSLAGLLSISFLVSEQKSSKQQSQNKPGGDL